MDRIGLCRAVRGRRGHYQAYLGRLASMVAEDKIMSLTTLLVAIGIIGWFMFALECWIEEKEFND